MPRLHRCVRVPLSLPLLALLPTAGAQQLNPWVATEEAELVASDAAAHDWFGYAVAISGDTAVVGAYTEDHFNVADAGAAYVFVRSGTGWSEQQKLTAPSGLAADHFGGSVAIDGDTIVVGVPGDDTQVAGDAGSAFVFVRSGTTWSQQEKLTASDAGDDHFFGYAVAIAGDSILIGAPDAVRGGAAYVFVRSGTSWSEQAQLVASDTAIGDSFGSCVALAGDTALVGAWGDDHLSGADAGSAYVFVRSGAAWSEQQKLIAGDGADDDYFGVALALAGDTAVVGAIGDDHAGGNEAGSAYAFVRSGTSWSEQQKLTASGAADADWFGYSIALVGDTALVGAPEDDTAVGEDVGSAVVFVRSGASWSEQQTLGASNAAGGDSFGASLAVANDTAIVGAYLANHPGMSNAGSAYAVRLEPGTPTSYCTAGTSASGCQALLSASGTPSATAGSGFLLLASGVEGAQNGLFFFGTNGRQANPWGNGTSFACVVPPVTRLGPLAGSGTSGQCDGSFAQDLNAAWCPTCPKAGKNPGFGATVQAQLWYRDPQSTSNQTTSFSDALEFSVGL